MYVNLYRAAPAPSMLELRGALDILHSAGNRLYDVNECENYHTHSKQMRIMLYKAYSDAAFILNAAAVAVKAEMGSL
jgi:uncharacterized membrane protein (DUF2068 family)